MTSQIIESSNFLIMLIAAFGVWAAVSWKAGNKVNERNEDVIIAWVWIFSAVGMSAAWFAISRHTAPDGYPFNQGMYEWRWLLKVGCACAFSWGMLKFIGIIDNYSRLRKAIYFLVFFVGAVGLGFY